MKNNEAEAVWRFFQKLQHNPDNRQVRGFLADPRSLVDLPRPNPKFADATKQHAIWSKKYREKGFFWCRFLRFLPGVRAVALCNSVALGTADRDSDIDLFIVTAPEKLWTARIFTTAFCQLFGIRRHGDRVAGRLCLSFFCTEAALDFERIALKPKDPYLAFWISSLVPVFGKDVFREISEKNQDFVRNHGISIRFESELAEVPSENSALKALLEKLLPDALERFFKKKLLPRAEHKRLKLADSSGIILAENMLKFHNRDRRDEFLD